MVLLWCVCRDRLRSAAVLPSDAPTTASACVTRKADGSTRGQQTSVARKTA